MGKESYANRLLEIHGINMWNMFHVDRAIQFAKQYRLTGIIFHCNELIDKVVFPEKYFSKDELLRFNPVRNSITKNNRYYLRSVLDRCRENGLEFYAEVKEIFFHMDLLTKYPQLRKKNGALCATDPFWWEFLEEKYKEFFQLFPDVAGIIVSPGTRESMVSFAANQCDCQRCREYDVDEWYQNLLSAMYRAVSGAGKKLIVRDFSYTKKHQYAMVEAAGAVSHDIIMSMKKVPHDYYPVFPDNPAIGNCGPLAQWVEYDTLGQFFGLGVFPCSVSEDMKGRMTRYLEKGASGVMLRTDWENLTQSSVFCSFNMLNLIAGAMLSCDVDTSMDEIYEEWFRYGLVSPLIPDTYEQIPIKLKTEREKQLFRNLMEQGWKIMEKGIHVRGHVFNRNCQIFDRYDLTYNIMTVFHNRDQWEPGASARVEPTKENIQIMIEEKDEAVRLAKELCKTIKDEAESIVGPVRAYLDFLAEGLVAYVEGFRLQLITTVYTKRTETEGDLEAAAAARESLRDYGSLANRYDALVRNRGYSHVAEYMLDGERLRRFKKDVERVLNSLQ